VSKAFLVGAAATAAVTFTAAAAAGAAGAVLPASLAVMPYLLKYALTTPSAVAAVAAASRPFYVQRQRELRRIAKAAGRRRGGNGNVSVSGGGGGGVNANSVDYKHDTAAVKSAAADTIYQHRYCAALRHVITKTPPMRAARVEFVGHDADDDEAADNGVSVAGSSNRRLYKSLGIKVGIITLASRNHYLHVILQLIFNNVRSSNRRLYKALGIKLGVTVCCYYYLRCYAIKHSLLFRSLSFLFYRSMMQPCL
jgi:hypothetical protein